MIKTSDLENLINKVAPLETQDEWDNSGWQVRLKDEFSTVMTALEIRSDIVAEAASKGVDLIVTHHPLIFGGISSVCMDSAVERNIIELIKHGISVFSVHTPFDKCEGGTNDTLGKVLGFKNVAKSAFNPEGYVRVGELAGEPAASMSEHAGNPTASMSELAGNPVASMSELASETTTGNEDGIGLEEFLDRASAVLGVDKGLFRYAGDPDVKIRKAAWCTGAGSEFMSCAKSEGCDIYITGDLKYHDAQHAFEEGINVLDLGHFGTENIFRDRMHEILSTFFAVQIEAGGLKVMRAETVINPFVK